jgi:hypothetical protein
MTESKINDYLKKLGKRGGEARKKQNPDYSAMGKRGMRSRWKDKRKNHERS